ncbi:Uncharacterised protein [Chlamydia trachomatis]|nr:Uncharacterised protein [Chlamydia trachomatis]
MPPEPITESCGETFTASTIDAAVGMPHSLKYPSIFARLSFSILAKFVPPNPPTSMIETPTECNCCTVSILIPNPTSFTMTGIPIVLLIFSILERVPAKSLSPSGIVNSWMTLICI